MGEKFFGIDIQAEIAKALPAGSIPAATLRKWTKGVRNPASLSGGTNPTYLDYSTRGIVSDFALAQVDGTMIMSGDKKVLLVAQPLAIAGVVPAVGDEVIAEGTTLRVLHVTRDPATATYELHCR